MTDISYAPQDGPMITFRSDFDTKDRVFDVLVAHMLTREMLEKAGLDKRFADEMFADKLNSILEFKVDWKDGTNET